FSRANETSRTTSWRGRKPIRNTLAPASCVAVEKAMTLTLASRATGPTAATSAAKSGPRISCAPSVSAERAALAALSGVPPVWRTAGNASAARMASGKGATAGGDPNHRVRVSKPGVAQFARSSAPGGIVAAESDPAAWAPEHGLAPGLHLVATPIGNLGDVT